MKKTRYWLSVDIGILHLGLVLIKISPSWQFEKVLWHQLENITIMKHRRIPLNKCELHHGTSITDRMAHVYQEYKTIFKGCEKILIERQPIQGLQAVQESIFNKYRSKVQLVSPNMMHKFFNIHHKNYEERKEETVKISRPYFSSVEYGGKALKNADYEIKRKFEGYRDKKDCTQHRLHDIADAICLAVMIIEQKKAKFDTKQKEKAAIDQLIIDGQVNLDCFRRQIK